MEVSEWLAQRDGHTIYDANKIFEDLDQETEVSVFVRPLGEFSLEWRDSKYSVYAYSGEEVYKMIVQRGLGGEFDPLDSKWFIAGYQIASGLAYMMTTTVSSKMGRGSAFRENIDIIRKVEHGSSQPATN